MRVQKSIGANHLFSIPVRCQQGPMELGAALRLSICDCWDDRCLLMRTATFPGLRIFERAVGTDSGLIAQFL
jgi:hypothetical protein